MTRKEIEQKLNIKLHRSRTEWEGYKLYQVDFGIPAGQEAVIGYPQFVLEKEGCAKWMIGDYGIGEVLMHFMCGRGKKRTTQTQISANRIKRVGWASEEGDFAVIGIFDNELFHIVNYKTDSQNPVIGFILDRASLEFGAPEKGFPELFVVNELKKLGAKHIRYTMYNYPENCIF